MSSLTEIVAKVLLLDESMINDDLTRSNVEEWDSMTHLVLISEIEQQFDFTFNDDDIASIQTIKDIKTILQKNNVSF